MRVAYNAALETIALPAVTEMHLHTNFIISLIIRRGHDPKKKEYRNIDNPAKYNDVEVTPAPELTIALSESALRSQQPYSLFQYNRFTTTDTAYRRS